MKKKLVSISIVLVCISSILLIIIQLYWIKLVVKTEETNFSISVSSVLENVVSTLEKKELTSRFFAHQFALSSPISTDTEEYAYQDSLNSASVSQKKQLKIYVSQNLSVDSGSAKRTNDSLVSATRMLGEYKLKILKRTDLLASFVSSMLNFMNYSPIETRVNTEALRTLLNEEFEKEGIQEEAVFGIYKKSTGRFSYVSDSNFNKGLAQSKFRYVLFPNDVSPPSRDVLVVYFPNHEKLIFQKIYWFLSAAILFLIIIFSVLGFFLFVILRQKKISEIKNEFINNITHEVKTPIATISLACEAMSETAILEKEQQEQYLNIIKDENKRLHKLVEQILTTARLESDILQIKNEEVDIHSIIETCTHNIEFIIVRKNGEIIKHLEAEDAIIKADKLHITNVISAILDNANKYTFTNPVIKVSTRNIKLGIEISISDNGIGVKKSEQNRIFEKFYRVSTGDVHDVKGYGIGLSYVKKVVEMHGGTVEIESELNKGSTFVIYLPKNGQPLSEKNKT